MLWSQMEEAWRDTLVHKAVGYALRANSDLYGLPWPEDEVTERAWRGALHVQALGRRGTFWSTFHTLEAGLSDYNEKITFDVDSGDPYVLTRTDGGQFTTKHLSRYIRTPFGLLFTVGSAATLPGTEISVCPASSRYWDAPSYDADTYDAEAVPGEILPFVVYERTPGPIIVNSDVFFDGAPCLFEVALFSEAMEPPVTYLQDTDIVTIGSVSTGANTLTASSGTYADEELVVFGTSTGGAVPGGLTAGDVYYIVNSSGATFQVEESIGGGAVDLTTTGTGTIFMERLSELDVPPGGNLLTDENVEGNTEAGGGPFPVYLYDGHLFPSLVAALEDHLPAGVHFSLGLAPLV